MHDAKASSDTAYHPGPNSSGTVYHPGPNCTFSTAARRTLLIAPVTQDAGTSPGPFEASRYAASNEHCLIHQISRCITAWRHPVSHLATSYISPRPITRSAASPWDGGRRVALRACAVRCAVAQCGCMLRSARVPSAPPVLVVHRPAHLWTRTSSHSRFIVRQPASCVYNIRVVPYTRSTIPFVRARASVRIWSAPSAVHDTPSRMQP